MRLTESDYTAFVATARDRFAQVEPQVRVEVEGSLTRGTLKPGYSDLDLRLVAPPGQGPGLRDRLPVIAAGLGELLAFFVDPASNIGTLCSLYPGPLKVDWFVCEQRGAQRVDIWSGRRPPPYDPQAHPWDWLWWLWSKIQGGDYSLARRELCKLWLFLELHGVEPAQLPSAVPPKHGDTLRRLVIETLPLMPNRHSRLGLEIGAAIRASDKP